MQVDAILELRLYRLAKLEILMIQKELGEKRKRGQAHRGAAQERRAQRWKLIRAELLELKDEVRRQAPHQDRRRGRRARVRGRGLHRRRGRDRVLCAQGWVKRVREVKDLARRACARATACSTWSPARPARRSRSSRTAAAATCAASTTCRRPPATATPVQKLFKLDDGERIVAHALLRSARARACRRRPRARTSRSRPTRSRSRARAGFRFSLRAAPRADHARRPALHARSTTATRSSTSAVLAARRRRARAPASDGPRADLRRRRGRAARRRRARASTLIKLDEGDERRRRAVLVGKRRRRSWSRTRRAAEQRIGTRSYQRGRARRQGPRHRSSAASVARVVPERARASPELEAKDEP